MRYYAVGAPIGNLQPTLLLAAKTRNIKQGELESSFFKQTTVRLFTSFDQAKEYAYGLRHKNYAFSYYPKTPLSRSKVWPIFTLEVDSEIETGKLLTETFTYEEHYVDDQRSARTREKTLDLAFYEIQADLIDKKDIIRAEIYKAGIAPIEFVHKEPGQACLIS